AWIWVAVALMGVPASASELRAIVIGFNNYQNLQKLLGAEADAVDIAAVLRKRGVHDLVVMSDPSETTEDFRAEWSAMTARASPGDRMMLTFAGHGIRVPETRTPKRTPDGYDKGFLFPTYDQDAHPDELLRDEDLYDLFKATAAKNLRILFVVDACHAGSGIRGNSTASSDRLRGGDYRSGPREGDKRNLSRRSQPGRVELCLRARDRGRRGHRRDRRHHRRKALELPSTDCAHAVRLQSGAGPLRRRGRQHHAHSVGAADPGDTRRIASGPARTQERQAFPAWRNGRRSAITRHPRRG